MDWFKVYSNENDLPEIVGLRFDYPSYGYDIYSFLRVHISKQPDSKLPYKNDRDKTLISHLMRYDQEKVSKVLDYLIDVKLIHLIDGYLFIPEISEVNNKIAEKSQKAKESVAKRWNKEDKKQTDNKPVNSNSPTANYENNLLKRQEKFETRPPLFDKNEPDLRELCQRGSWRYLEKWYRQEINKDGLVSYYQKCDDIEREAILKLERLMNAEIWQCINGHEPTAFEEMENIFVDYKQSHYFMTQFHNQLILRSRQSELGYLFKNEILIQV